MQFTDRDHFREILEEINLRASHINAELRGLKEAEEGARQRDSEVAAAIATEMKTRKSGGVALMKPRSEASDISLRESALRAERLTLKEAKKMTLQPVVPGVTKLLEELSDGGSVRLNDDGNFVVSVTVPDRNYRPLLAKVADIPPPPKGHVMAEYTTDVVFDAASAHNLDRLVEAVVDMRITSNPALKGRFTADKLKPAVTEEVEAVLYGSLGKARSVA